MADNEALTSAQEVYDSYENNGNRARDDKEDNSKKLIEQVLQSTCDHSPAGTFEVKSDGAERKRAATEFMDMGQTSSMDALGRAITATKRTRYLPVDHSNADSVEEAIVRAYDQIETQLHKIETICSEQLLLKNPHELNLQVLTHSLRHRLRRLEVMGGHLAQSSMYEGLMPDDARLPAGDCELPCGYDTEVIDSDDDF